MKVLGKWALCGLAVVLAARPAAADELPMSPPEKVGLDGAKLDRAKAAVQAMVDKKEIAGAVVAVARHGKLARLDAVGRMDVEKDRAMRPDAIFRVYSMTKPITTVAAMILSEEGRLGLDDPVAKYLPEFRELRVHAGESGTAEAKRAMTVRDLMRHTSGLTYGVFGETPVDRLYRDNKVMAPGDSLAELVAKLGKLPLLHQPGTRFHYSVSTDVLGRVVEVASGKPLDEFFAERIFKPLDMRDTGFSVPADKMDRFTTNYGPGEKGGLKATDAPATSRYRQKPKFLSGGGGLVSTARDYVRFCQMLAGEGALPGTRLLRPETVRAMTRNHLPDEAMPLGVGGAKRPGVGFGLGFSVRVAPDKSEPAGVVGEYGWGGAASTHFWISPKHNLVVVALQQYMPYNSRLENTLKPIIYEAVKE